LQFKLDENIPFSLKKIIETYDKQHQVESVFHENLAGINDQSLLEKCKEEERILITLDTDFDNPFLHPSSSCFGIIILRPPSQGKKTVNALFTNFISQYPIEEIIGKILIVHENSINVRAD